MKLADITNRGFPGLLKVLEKRKQDEERARLDLLRRCIHPDNSVSRPALKLLRLSEWCRNGDFG